MSSGFKVLSGVQARHRKAAKAKMAAATDDFYQAVFNAEQLAYKLGRQRPLVFERSCSGV